MVGQRLRVIVVGCGRMGAAHARAYHALPGYELVGLVARRPGPGENLAAELGGCRVFRDLTAGIRGAAPDAVCVATTPESHAELCQEALRAGTHVFVEKPLSDQISPAETVVEVAQKCGRALVVGYILRHHPTWVRFIELAQGLGRPLVMRISQNQQSAGAHWETHQRLMHSVSPLVDCGVHYVDVMCQMAGARPSHVQAVGARLHDGLPSGRLNYGQLQLSFAGGSVGWYEAGWGPMMSQEADFTRDVVGPEGAVTMAVGPAPGGRPGTLVTRFIRHHAALDARGELARRDEVIPVEGEPTLDQLCRREQEFFRDSIVTGRDLRPHHIDALATLRIVLAAERSIRERRVVSL